MRLGCMSQRGRLLAAAALSLLLAASSPAWASGGEGGGGINPGDLGQAVATILVFVLLLVILGRFAWKPLVKQIQSREQIIADAIVKAEQREKESQELLAHYRQRLDRADAEAQDLMAQTRKDAAVAREQILDAARQEAALTVQRATEDIELAKDGALRELRQTTADLATDLAGRIIHKSLRAEDHRHLLDESLAEIAARASKD